MVEKRRFGSSYSANDVLPKRPKTSHSEASTNEYVEDLLRSEGELSPEASIIPTQPVAAVPKWTLTPEQVPSDAKKIYCVLRGVMPGFYFDWTTCELQVRGVKDNLFMSFPQGNKKAAIKPGNKPQIVSEAIAYMNHNSESCVYKCGGKCRSEAAANAALEARAQPQGNLAAPKRKNRNSCTECGRRAPTRPARVCDECMSCSQMASRLETCTAKFSLNAEQSRVLRLVASGRNVFFTGAAGTGKSRVIEAIVAFLKTSELDASVVAPTGMAALNVFGTTLHMWAGWTVKHGESPLKDLVEVAHEKKVWKRIRDTDVLILDEISMVNSHTFQRLSFMCEEATARRTPFGDIQLLITGDFFQLPPVLPFKTCLECGIELQDIPDGQGTKLCADHGEFRDEDKWPFRNQLWSACNFANVKLTQIHRQTDRSFTDLLHGLREGRWTAEQEALLLEHPNDVVFSEAVKLYPTRREVDQINEHHMRTLAGPVRKYQCVDDLTWQQMHPEFLEADGMSTAPLATLHNHRYSDELELKEGMQVILLQNLDVKAGLVNGSSGKIVGLEEMKEIMLPRAQKKSKDSSTHGEVLITHIHRHYAEERIRSFWNRNQSGHWPIVRFQNGIERTIYAHCSIKELGREEPYSLLSRTQVPLLAGWGITIHKSQGMTLSNVVVSLDKAFAPGQAYVALSRAKSLRTMIVQTMPSNAQLLAPDATVQQFMKETFG